MLISMDGVKLIETDLITPGCLSLITDPMNKTVTTIRAATPSDNPVVKEMIDAMYGITEEEVISLVQIYALLGI